MEMAKKEKLLKLAQEHLDIGEEVVHSVMGVYETEFLKSDMTHNGIFIATNHRLVFYGKRLTGYDLEFYPYNTISLIETGKKMLGYYLNFFASGNKVKMKWIQDSEFTRFVSYVREKIGKKESAPTVNQIHQPVDVAEELRKFKNLLDEGIITEEEFNAKKKQLLGI
jgi:hypothetical protein